MAALADLPRGLDAVAAAVEPDVHEHQIGRELGGHGDPVLAIGGDSDDLVADARELPPDIARDHPIVLDDEDARAGHGLTLRSLMARDPWVPARRRRR